MNQILSYKKNSWKAPILVLAIFVVLGLAANVLLAVRNNNNQASRNPLPTSMNLSLIENVSAAEIYPLFECPCCGKDIAQCNCPMAKERRIYVDGLADAEASKDKIILSYIKKYGLSSFMNEQMQKEFRAKLAREAPADRPVISLNLDTYDFGDVSQKEGIITTFFEVKNEGKSNLIIDRLESSCGCTSASIIYQSKEGPKFSMPGHGVNEEISDWQVVIGPGEKAEIKVYYDPNVHQDFRGFAVREISIFSNDPIDFEKKIKIELNQVD